MSTNETQNPFSLRLACLELSASLHPDEVFPKDERKIVAQTTKIENVLLTATKFYNFVNGDFTAIPELQDKISIVPKDGSSVARTMIKIADKNYEDRVIERVQKDPSRNVFYIDVEKVDPNDAEEAINNIKEQFEAASELKRVKVMAGLSESIDMRALKNVSGDTGELSLMDSVALAKMKKLAGTDIPVVDGTQVVEKLKKKISLGDQAPEEKESPLEELFLQVPTNTLELDAIPSNYTKIIQMALTECLSNAKICVFSSNYYDKMNEFFARIVVDHRPEIIHTNVYTSVVDLGNPVSNKVTVYTTEISFKNGGKLILTNQDISGEVVDFEISGDEILVREAKMSTQPVIGHNGRMIHLVDGRMALDDLWSFLDRNVHHLSDKID